MMSIFKEIKNLRFFSKRVTYSTQKNEVETTKDPKTEFLEEAIRLIDNNKPIPHELAASLIHSHYDIVIKKSMFKLRNTKSSLLFFEIDGIQILTSDNGKKLDDINLILKDASLNTSLTLTLSVNDYEELLEPIKFE